MRKLAPFLLFLALLSWPIAANRTVILYPDTGRYLMNGLNVWGAAAKLVASPPQAPAVLTPAIGSTSAKPKLTLGGRSPYYGAFAWAARSLGGLKAIGIAQAAWVALVLLLALPRLGIRDIRAQLVVVAALAGFSHLAFFAAVVMPDVFVGVAVISLVLIWFQWAAMKWPERSWWIANVLAASLFHTSFAVLSMALLFCLAAVQFREPRLWLGRAVVLFAAIGAGVVGTMAMDLAIKKATGRAVTPIPFLLARTIGDGTAVRVLQEDCPRVPYFTCRYLKDFPLTENEFLWGRPGLTGWNLLPAEQQATINSEQRPIVAEAVRRYPMEQARRSVGNSAMLFVTSDLDEFSYSSKLEGSLRNPLLAKERAESYTSRIYREQLVLRNGVTKLWLLSYFASVIMVIAALAYRRRLDLESPIVAFAWAIVLALVLSAIVHGTLGGVWGRYTARIGWLGVLALLVVFNNALIRSGRFAAPGAARSGGRTL